MTSAEREIQGVSWGKVLAHADARGAFRELWRATAFTLAAPETGVSGAHFVQANLSHSVAGVLRGLHYHRRQLDHWVVAEGEVFVALVDLRDTGRRPLVVTRHLNRDESVTIPVLVAHGFLALQPTTLVYFVTSEYDGKDELGLAWDDLDLAIKWPSVDTPDRRPILSGRDRSNPSFADVRLEVAGRG